MTNLHGFEEFGIVIDDGYAEFHPQDSELWLRLLLKAREISLNFYSILHYLRSHGTILQEDKKFKYRLVPLIGATAWKSVDEYNGEKHYLTAYGQDLVKLLKEL